MLDFLEDNRERLLEFRERLLEFRERNSCAGNLFNVGGTCH